MTTQFEMDGVGLNKIIIESPRVTIDLDVVEPSDWTNESGPGCTVLDSNADVTVSLTGFWGQNSQLQITVSYAGANKIGTTTFESATVDEDVAVIELNLAIEKLLTDYLPTQGWRII